jgi:hypothetical protein
MRLKSYRAGIAFPRTFYFSSRLIMMQQVIHHHELSCFEARFAVICDRDNEETDSRTSLEGVSSTATIGRE